MTGIKEPNYQPSEFEQKWIVCEVCGMEAKTIAGIKRHKAMKKHWGQPADPAVLKKYQEKEDNAPSTVEETVVPKQEPTETVVPKQEEAPAPAPEPTVAPSPLPPAEPPQAPDPPQAPEEPEEPEAPAEPLYINPAQMGITEISIGSQLAVLGNVFQPEGGSYLQALLTEPTPSTVIKRWLDGHNNPFLEAQNDVTGIIYVIAEPQVIPPGGTEPQIKIMRIGPPKQEDLAPQPPAPEEDNAVHEEFYDAFAAYVKARDAKSDATNHYKDIDEDARPIMLDYLSTFGEPSEEGAKDSTLNYEGYKLLHAYNEVPDKVERDDDAIIQKCVKEGWLHAIEPVYQIKEEVWEALKKSGNIPADFLKKVEVITPQDPKRALYVTKLDE